jgi:excinuclease ABC subunit C
MPSPYPTIAEQVSSVPDSPGVYLWKAADGSVLYVGKAKSLRKRMRQYTSGQDEREDSADDGAGRELRLRGHDH